MDPITTQITATLPLTDYIHYFQPIVTPSIDGIYGRGPELTTTITYTFDLVDVFLQSGPYGATIVDWLVQTVVVDYYIRLRIAMTALVFIVGFVMRRIRLGKAMASDVIINVGESFRRRR